MPTFIESRYYKIYNIPKEYGDIKDCLLHMDEIYTENHINPRDFHPTDLKWDDSCWRYMDIDWWERVEGVIIEQITWEQMKEETDKRKIMRELIL